MKVFGSAAAIYREIESSQGLFKYNGARLTLRDQGLRPFKGMSEDEIDHFLSSMIEKIGLRVEGIIRPGHAGARSSKFPTFIAGDARYPLVFGFAYSAAEEIQISELSRALQKIVERDGHATVWNGECFVEVNGVIRRGGSREKVDAIMHLDGRPMISISLKNLKSGRASEMQGWSGIKGHRGDRSIVLPTERRTLHHHKQWSGEGSSNDDRSARCGTSWEAIGLRLENARERANRKPAW